MSKDVLISVNKEHLDNILDGIKTIEWRKKPLPLGKHYGYETKNKGGCGKVTGEFEIVENIKVDLFDIVCNDPKELIKKGCVDWGFLNKYAGIERPYLYANVIENAKRYDKPKDLSEFTIAFHCFNHKNVESKTNAFGDYVSQYFNNSFCRICKYYNSDFGDCDKPAFQPLKRPPQSWCYVEAD